MRRDRTRETTARRLAARATRVVLVGILALAATMAWTSGTQDAVANGDTRAIAIRHMHTGEELTVTFRRNGRYDDAALRQLNRVLRDWRNDRETRMDPRLFDALWEVHRSAGSRQPLHVVSAFRSPETNAMLRRRSRAVAESSQHMAGRAVDFYLPDVDAARLRDIGMRLQRGGVGFYPRANTPFVHVDVGSVRHWPRLTRAQLTRLFPDERTVHIPTDGKPMAGFDEARRQIIAAGGTVFGESGAQIAEAARRPRSLWAALFGGDDDAAEDEAYAELPANQRAEVDPYALMRPAPAPAPVAVAAAPAPRAVAPAPAPAPAPVPVLPAPAPAAPAPVAVALAPPPPPPAPERIEAPAASPAERARVAAIAAAALAPAAPAPAPSAPAQVAAAAPLPAPRPAELGGARPAEAGPRLVWTQGAPGVPSADAAVAALETPLPPPRFDRPTAVAAAAPVAPPAAASAFAPLPPARAGADAFAALAPGAAPALRGPVPPEAPAAASSEPARPTPLPPPREARFALASVETRTVAAPAVTASTAPRERAPARTPAPGADERAALRALFAAQVSLAPAPAAAAPVRLAEARPRADASAPRGLVAAPSAGVAQGFSRERPLADANRLAAGPAVRPVPTLR